MIEKITVEGFKEVNKVGMTPPESFSTFKALREWIRLYRDKVLGNAPHTGKKRLAYIRCNYKFKSGHGWSSDFVIKDQKDPNPKKSFLLTFRYEAAHDLDRGYSAAEYAKWIADSE